MVPTTSWTLVLDAAQRDTPVGQAALAELCRRYWTPIYVYIRRRGRSPEDAAEITQDLFARLMERDRLAQLERGGGRFRGFLKVTVDRMLVNRHRDASAAKRGGPHATLSLHLPDGELRHEQVDEGASPEEAFELSWALVIRDRAMQRLEAHYDTDAKRERWKHLGHLALRDPEPGEYETLAARMNVRESAVRVAVTRMRKKLMDFAREEAADTVSEAAQVEGELRSVSGQLVEGVGDG